jgi:drug/metabolite transporter (DMT)-like permease
MMLAMGWMMGSLLSFCATAIAVRSLSSVFSVFEILSLRNVIGILILLGAACIRPDLRSGFKLRRWKLHVLRNVVHFLGTAGWTYSLTILPMATVFAIEFTSPAWVAVLAVPFLGERLSRARVVALVAGLAGVLIILRPGLGVLETGSLIMLPVAFSFAVVAVVTKRLTLTETSFSILFYMNAMQLPLNLLGSESAFWLRLEPMHAVPFLGVGLGGLLSHFCLTNAYRYGDAGMVVTLDFLRIPIMAVVALFLYGEAFDPFLILGSACIVGGLLYSLRKEASAA